MNSSMFSDMQQCDSLHFPVVRKELEAEAAALSEKEKPTMAEVSVKGDLNQANSDIL